MSPALAETCIVRLGRADLPAYKALRDSMLAAYPESFTSDADTERARSADSYAARIGAAAADGAGDADAAVFTLGAWRGEVLLGAISGERDARLKVRHVGHIVGMMVRDEDRGRGIGRALLEACIAASRDAGLLLLTLSVTAGNTRAIHLYKSCGFERYGTLRRAIRIGDTFLDKDLMSRSL